MPGSPNAPPGPLPTTGFEASRTLALDAGAAAALCQRIGPDGILALAFALRRSELPAHLAGRGLRCAALPAAGAGPPLPELFEEARAAAAAEAAEISQASACLGLHAGPDCILWALGVLDDFGSERPCAGEAVAGTEPCAGGDQCPWSLQTCRRLPADLLSPSSGGRRPGPAGGPCGMGNAELILRHGFCVKGNPHDQIGPLHLDPDEDDPASGERLVVLAHRGISTEHWLAAQPVGQASGAPPAGLLGLLECLRVLLCRGSPAEAPSLSEAVLRAKVILDASRIPTSPVRNDAQGSCRAEGRGSE
ncbi:unnamed protein product [Prorocentrum cordatum]|uniref:Uncharacterized protein n=1 Tax=Prorocentrum cordatum TaxID=2364126 RepID=A0ABN9RG78_9DINO|nr:unnamed protein product [Polarella glacialis]